MDNQTTETKIWMPVHPSVLKKLKYFIETKKVPHLLFHGNSGTGKYVIADQFVKSLFPPQCMSANVLRIDCAHESGIQFVRSEIKTFAKSNVQGNLKFKVVMLLNSDKMTINAQSALRRCIEIYSHNTRFIIIVDNIDSIMTPILSRFCTINIPDRMDTNGDVVSLYKIDEFFNPPEVTPVEIERETKLRKVLIPLFSDNLSQDVSKHTDPSEWMVICNQLYFDAFSAYDMIRIGGECMSPAKKTEWEMEFLKIKGEMKCEPMLMFYLCGEAFCEKI